MQKLSADLTVDELLIKIKETQSNQNIGLTTQAVLKHGPRAYKIATLFEILDSKTDEIHHYHLKIETYSKTKEFWKQKSDKSISLSTEHKNEIGKLADFLNSYRQNLHKFPEGEYRVLSEEKIQELNSIINTVSGISQKDKLKVLGKFLSEIEDKNITVQDLEILFRKGETDLIEKISIAAKITEYKKNLSEFKKMIENQKIKEHDYQDFLEKNPWLFGSEYSESLDRRKWTRDSQLDFMLRRTVDNILELIEIKTPSTGKLFNHDKSHDSYYPTSSLSSVLGQVMKYIEEIDTKRDSIKANDEEEILKIKAKIIMGRDGDEEQQIALRNFNAHLYRIEVMTFDQLIRIGKRTLDIFTEKNS